MNIYVGNLHFQLEEEDLKKIFANYPSLDSVKLIKDKETGKSKGFGFISFNDKAEAKQALEELQGAVVAGRPIRLNLATNQGPNRKNNRFNRQSSHEYDQSKTNTGKNEDSQKKEFSEWE